MITTGYTDSDAVINTHSDFDFLLRFIVTPDEADPFPSSNNYGPLAPDLMVQVRCKGSSNERFCPAREWRDRGNLKQPIGEKRAALRLLNKCVFEALSVDRGSFYTI
ncbi:unnamed protein product [Arctogadus glacialis]